MYMYLCVAIIARLKIATDTVAKVAKNLGLVTTMKMMTTFLAISMY